MTVTLSQKWVSLLPREYKLLDHRNGLYCSLKYTMHSNQPAPGTEQALNIRWMNACMNGWASDRMDEQKNNEHKTAVQEGATRPVCEGSFRCTKVMVWWSQPEVISLVFVRYSTTHTACSSPWHVLNSIRISDTAVPYFFNLHILCQRPQFLWQFDFSAW